MKSYTFYINVLIFSTLITFLGYLPFISSSFLGLNLTGYGWFVVFITSIILFYLYQVIKNLNQHLLFLGFFI